MTCSVFCRTIFEFFLRNRQTDEYESFTLLNGESIRSSKFAAINCALPLLCLNTTEHGRLRLSVSDSGSVCY